MIFLVEYDRTSGELKSMTSFPDEPVDEADDSRLALELALMEKQRTHEVVLLQAQSEEDLRRTHRRYFERIEEIAAASGDSR
jgi:hypothetical protein